MMVDKVEAPDPTTVVVRLKFATDAFLPALAGPYNWIYRQAHLDEDPRWYARIFSVRARSNSPVSRSASQ